MDEAELNRAMNRYAAGEASAFLVLHRGLYARLYGYLLRMRGSSHVAEDLAQETFLRMHRARSTFAIGASVVPWMYTIARNVLIDHSRSAKTRSAEELSLETAPDHRDESADTESAALASEAARIVDRTLQILPTSQREAFVLLRYEGLSVHDAAEVLGTTPAAVKLRAFRAYEALRSALGEHASARDREKVKGAPKPTPADVRSEQLAARGSDVNE